MAFRTEITPAGNSRFAKAGCSCFYDSEVLNSSFVHLQKFSGENPRLRKAAKRYNSLLRFVIQVQFLMESSGLKNQNFTHNLIE